MIEAMIEFQVNRNQLLANFKNEPCVADPSVEKTEHPKDYRLVKDPKTQIVYCVKMK